MLRDVPLLRVAAVRAGHAGAEGEIGDARGKGFELVHLHQVEVVGHPVDQVQGVRTALLGDLLQHRGERRQAGAAGEQQQRPRDLAQVEAAQWAGQGHAVARQGLPGEEAAHQAARHVANEEADFAVLLQGAERIGAALLAARHLEVDVLARQEGQLAQRLALDRQGDGAVGELAHGADRRLEAGLLGLAHL